MIRSRRFRTDYYGYLFLVPFIVAFLIFGLYPVINTVLSEFHEHHADGGEGEFCRLEELQPPLCG